MKIPSILSRLCILSLTLLSILSIAPASGQILSYNFNTPGSSQANAGTGGGTGDISTLAASGTVNVAGPSTDFIGAPGSGVSGLASDRALNFTSGTVGGMGPTGSGGTVTALGGLNSFTIAGWAMGVSNSSTAAQRILRETSGGTIDLFYNSTSPTNKNLSLNVDGQTVTSGAGLQYAGFETGSWTFFAVTYDTSAGANGQAVFYSGGLTGALTATTVNFTINPGATGSAGQLFIGNSGANTQRPFDGWLDDIALYGAADSSGALSSSALTSLRNLNAVPEPGSLALFLIGAACLYLFKVRRRKSIL